MPSYREPSLHAPALLVAALVAALLVVAASWGRGGVAEAAAHPRLATARAALHDSQRHATRVRREAPTRCRAARSPRCRAARRRLARARAQERAAQRTVRRLRARRARDHGRPDTRLPAVGTPTPVAAPPTAARPPAAAPPATSPPAVTPPSVAPQTAGTSYVAPMGSDANPGTSDRPLRTIDAALARAQPNERIAVAAGTYPKVTDTRSRTGTVELAGAGAAATKVAGMDIAGGQGLDIHGFGFTSTVKINEHPTRQQGQPALGVTLRDSDLTAPGVCLYVRSGARSIRILRNRIHHCSSGIVGPGNTATSTGITIEGNTVEHVTADAIQFGDWDHVRIAHNALRDMRDPAGVIHNDGIQFTGDSRHVEIVANRISDSRHQLLFIQDAIGPIDDVTVENNVIAHAGAVAVQVQGATRARFVHNTVWDTRYGGLWLRQGYNRDSAGPVIATDTVVVNNVLSSYRVMEGAAAAVAAGNVTQCVTGQQQTTSPTGGWACLPSPGFAAVASDDFRLAPTAPARALGSPLATTPRDIDDAVRTSAPVPGAHR